MLEVDVYIFGFMWITLIGLEMKGMQNIQYLPVIKTGRH